jgi:hypothetical protein
MYLPGFNMWFIRYIHGQPYVLRLASSPFRNLRDTPGIAGERIDNMEERLKAEIVGQWVGMAGW